MIVLENLVQYNLAMVLVMSTLVYSVQFNPSRILGMSVLQFR